jgi:antitoxin (DNA-binding transcriptional repressor) of toxin-antitoxin stability system
MNKQTVTAEDLHKGLGRILQQAASHETYTLVTRHGVPSVAIIPVNGMYAWTVSKAIREAEALEDKMNEE